MEDLIRIRVADAAEDTRIGECSLERVPFPREGGTELFCRCIERLDSAGVMGTDSVLAANEVNRGASLRAGLGE